MEEYIVSEDPQTDPDGRAGGVCGVMCSSGGRCGVSCPNTGGSNCGWGCSGNGCP